jgi:type IV secretory pathway TrbF-like protein
MPQEEPAQSMDRSQNLPPRAVAPHLTFPHPKDFETAQRQYVEQFGSILVMNTYLKIAVLALSLVNLGLVALNIRTYRAFRDLKPLVIRINNVGRAEAVRYETLEYRPQEAEIKYFLTDFVERHYARMRSTARENYARSLYFLDGRLADALIEANKKTKTLETFLAGAGEEIDVHVTDISIEDLRTAPYRAAVDFEKVYYASDHTETKREKFIAHFVFIVKDHVPNTFVPVNPLGLTITYFREDQAFQ